MAIISPLIRKLSWRNETQEPSTWGLRPVGLLTYTRYGYMSANMAATEEDVRPLNIGWPPEDTDSDADWALVGRHAMAYAGPFSINQSAPATKYQGELLHGPHTVASVPDMVGRTQARKYVVTERDGEVYLTVSVQKGVLRSEILWKRIVKG